VRSASHGRRRGNLPGWNRLSKMPQSPQKKRPPPVGRGRGSQASGRELPAETVMTAIPVAVPAEDRAPVKMHKGATVAEASEVPPSGNPISIGLVAGDPDVSRSRAGRNVGYRSARVNPKFDRLGRRRSQDRRASDHRCTKHPIPHAAHIASVPAGQFCQRSEIRGRSGFIPGGGLSLAASPVRRLCPDSTRDAGKGCVRRVKIYLRNFLKNRGLWRFF
jgi:hypothetical protein